MSFKLSNFDMNELYMKLKSGDLKSKGRIAKVLFNKVIKQIILMAIYGRERSGMTFAQESYEAYVAGLICRWSCQRYGLY